jgi:hypothetical protein
MYQGQSENLYMHWHIYFPIQNFHEKVLYLQYFPLEENDTESEGDCVICPISLISEFILLTSI